MPTASQLVSQGYGGYQGWGDAEANADFNATGGSGKKSGGGSLGGGSVADYGAAMDLLGRQKADNSTFLAGQNAASQDYLNRYTQAIQNQETMSAMARRLGQELNLPTLSENAYNVNRTMRELPQTYSAATRGFDVNANQLSRIIGQKSSELAPTLATANEALANAQTSLNTQLGYGQAEQAKALLPYQTEQQLLSDRLAREMTLYTKENENELNTLIAKIQSGIQISEAEKDRANKLAVQEQQYKLARENAVAADWKEITIGGNKYRMNMSTGEKQLLGSATAGGTGTGNINSYYTPTQALNSNTPILPPTNTKPASDVNPLVTSQSTLNAQALLNRNTPISGNIPLTYSTSNTGLYTFK